jgi:hypothetical protein
MLFAQEEIVRIGGDGKAGLFEAEIIRVHARREIKVMYPGHRGKPGTGAQRAGRETIWGRLGPDMVRVKRRGSV